MDLRGKITLITGASDGIGAACARAFERRGARLVLNARNTAKLDTVAPGALTVPGDITDPDVRQRFIRTAIDHHGRIDILVNNAGVGLYQPAATAPMDEVRRLLELNFFAVLATTQLALPHMRQARTGTVVNISSMAGLVTLPWFTLYSASKFAVCSLSDGLRLELRRDGIHVIAVCPGYVNTGFQSNIIGGKVPKALVSSRRFAITADQCAEAVVQGVERRKRTVVTPRLGWAFVALARLFPSLVDAQLERMYATREDGEMVR